MESGAALGGIGSMWCFLYISRSSSRYPPKLFSGHGEIVPKDFWLHVNRKIDQFSCFCLL